MMEWIMLAAPGPCQFRVVVTPAVQAAAIEVAVRDNKEWYQESKEPNEPSLMYPLEFVDVRLIYSNHGPFVKKYPQLVAPSGPSGSPVPYEGGDSAVGPRTRSPRAEHRRPRRRLPTCFTPA